MLRGVRYHDKKRLCYFIKKGESKIFYKQIINLYKSVRTEWVEQGNIESAFAELGVTILTILNNASYHKKKEILQKIE
jgi:hypothetical protein